MFAAEQMPGDANVIARGEANGLAAALAVRERHFTRNFFRCTAEASVQDNDAEPPFPRKFGAFFRFSLLCVYRALGGKVGHAPQKFFAVSVRWRTER